MDHASSIICKNPRIPLRYKQRNRPVSYHAIRSCSEYSIIIIICKKKIILRSSVIKRAESMIIIIESIYSSPLYLINSIRTKLFLLASDIHDYERCL